MAKDKDNSDEGKPIARYLSQSDVPSMPLTEALRVAEAIKGNYGYKPSAPLLVAKALDVKPLSSRFRMLTGASIAYGITDGGAQSSEIAITELGMRIVKPLKEGDDLNAKREALLRPRVIGEFLQQYDGAPVPPQHIAENVLHEAGVPENKTAEVFKLIVDEARKLGLIEEIKGAQYVHLAGTYTLDEKVSSEDATDLMPEVIKTETEIKSQPDTKLPASPLPSEVLPKTLRVFISHGKNMEIVEQVETMLGMADLKYEIAVKDETPAIPVPDKIFDAMRRCTFAVIIVSVDESRKDDEGHYTINENVLIEIGAAFVLYDRKVVLVWDKRLPVPSNLQGLYRCEFEGDELSWKAGMKLMKAVKEFRQ